MADVRGDDQQPRRIAADWLSLRETLDAAARHSTVDAVRTLLAESPPRTVIDVGCGTGSGGRWLLPLLRGNEDWVLIDHDADLLAHTAARLRASGARGEISTRCADLAELGPALTEAGDAALVICSALLDLLTPHQLEALVTDLAEHRTPFLLALSVTGGIAIQPGLPEDERFAAAFNRHQQRGGRCGPEAASRTATLAQRAGFQVTSLETDWQLDSAEHDAGRLDALHRFITDRATAAAEQLSAEGQADQAAHITSGWLPRRRRAIDEGTLGMRVEHVDLIGVPGRP